VLGVLIRITLAGWRPHQEGSRRNHNHFRGFGKIAETISGNKTAAISNSRKLESVGARRVLIGANNADPPFHFRTHFEDMFEKMEQPAHISAPLETPLRSTRKTLWHKGARR
jgi:hypothetical protein